MITLVLGGARSGKSVVAERLAARLPEPVSYLATAPAALVAADADMAARVAAHQARRSSNWRTIEATGCLLSDVVAAAEGTLLVESLGTWLTGTPGFDVDVDGLCHALLHRRGDTVLVSEEVGLGVHPSSDTGRRFRDALGEVNQAVAAIADEVVLVVAGRALALQDTGLDEVGRRDTRPRA